MTTRIVQEILKNIEKKEGVESDYQLYKILESNREIIENKNKINEKEKEYRQETG